MLILESFDLLWSLSLSYTAVTFDLDLWVVAAGTSTPDISVRDHVVLQLLSYCPIERERHTHRTDFSTWTTNVADKLQRQVWNVEK